MAAYLAVSTTILAASFNGLRFGPLPILLGLAATFASTIILDRLIRAAEPDSIATPRRVGGMVLSGTLLWLFAVALGLVYSIFSPSQNPATTMTIGAFFVCAFELVVINGAFLEKTRLAGPLSVVHPALVFFSSGPGRVSAQAVGAGVIVVGLALVFVLRLKSIRTPTNVSAIHALQAFLKTWAARNPEELEKVLSRRSLEESVGTKIIKFEAPEKQPALVLSSIHPGPFFPVGSYNLPELFFEKFNAEGMTALTMHRPGGHERNLATRAECLRYTTGTATLARALRTEIRPKMRGPVMAKIDDFSAACMAFGDHALVMVSSSPQGSDDITHSIEGELSSLAKASGFNLSLVDAHNSIGTKKVKFVVEDDRPWRELLERLRREGEREFRVGFAHSSELAFSHGPDISDAGLGVLIFDVAEKRWALVSVDSNNASPKLKAEVKEKLETGGFELIEVCTTDSHNLAARGIMIERGYFALGEATPVQDVSSLIVRLAKIAESRLSYRNYGVGEFCGDVRVLGAKAIEDFASLARRASTFAKRFVMVAVPITLVLLIVVMLD